MKVTTLVRISALSVLSLSALNLAACTNTLRGAGQDVENAGEAMQDASH